MNNNDTEKNKKYFFNAIQAPYLGDMTGLVFLKLTEEEKKRLKSDVFTKTPYRYGVCIQVDQEKLGPFCQPSLIHKALSSLENNPGHYALAKALRNYLKLDPEKMKEPVEAHFLKKMGQIIGGIIGVISSLSVLAILATLVPLGMAFPILSISISSLAVLCVVITFLTTLIGGFLGSQIAKHINQNRIQLNLEEKLEQLMAKSDQIDSISKKTEPREEASSIASLNFFCPGEC